MITDDLTAQLALPEELYPVLDMHHGLVLVSGEMNTGKTTMLRLLTREFDKKHSFGDSFGGCIFINNSPQDKVQKGYSERVYQLPDIHVTDEQFKNTRQRYNTMLRFDPDLIVDEEIRTSEDAIHRFSASVTGRIVYSTIHAPDAQTAIDKYRMLLPPFYDEENYEEEKKMMEMVLKSVIHMKRDEITGLPVVGEVKIF